MRTFGCCRYVYNYYLALRKETYEQTRRNMSYYVCAKDLTSIKNDGEHDWLKEADSTALQTSIRNLDMAFQNFFRSVRNGSCPKYPRHKKKRGGKQSYTSKNVNNNIKIIDKKLQLPKLGLVNCRISRGIRGKIISATVSRTRSGKYFVSLCCSVDEELPKPTLTGAVIGLDLGVKSYAVTSDGVEYPNPKYLKKSEHRLKHLGRQLSRKTKGSNNWEKARIRVAKLHEHITNQRRDMQQKLSTELIKENDIICIEDLSVNEIVSNHSLSKAVLDAAWGEFRRELEYKSKWYGRRLVIIDRYYPSSQLCSCCGAQWSGTKNLSVRNWKCDNCGANHNRDVNAAINILNEGLRQID